MNRQLVVQISSQTAAFEAGIARSIASLTRIGNAAAQMGQRLGQSMANATRGGIDAINRFATQSNATLASFYARADQQQRTFEAGWGRLANNLQGAGKAMAVGLTLPLALLAGQSFKTYAEIDSLQRGLTAVMHSADAAGREFKNLREVAALPGLGLQEAVQGSVRLQTVGFSADGARKALLQFGNAIALAGGGKAELASVTTQLAQLAAKGKVLSQDLRPIIEAAPAIAPVLQRIFNSVDPEEISSKLKAAGKDSRYFIEILTTELGKLERVSGGPKNAMENLGDSVAIAQYNFGLAADKALGLSDKLDRLGSAVTSGADGFGNLTEGSQVAILALGGLAAATGPVLVGVGSMIRLIPQLKLSLLALAGTPAIVLGIAAAVVTLGVAAYSATRPTVDLISKTELLANVNQKATSSIVDERTALNLLYRAATDDRKSKDERKRAIDELNTKYPQYLGFLNAENINSAQAAEAIRKQGQAIEYRAKARAAEDALAAIYKQKFDAEQKPVSDFAKPILNRTSPGLGGMPQINSPVKIAEMAQKDKNEALLTFDKRAQNLLNYIDKNERRATRRGITIEAPAVVEPPKIDLANIGGDSAIKILKDQVKAAKDAVESFKALNPGKAVPVELMRNYQDLTAQLKAATSATTKHTAEATTQGSALTTNERILKRLTQELKEQGEAAPQSLKDQVAAMSKLVALDQARADLAKNPRVDVGPVAPIVTPDQSARVKAIVDSFHELARLNPSLFKDTGLSAFMNDLQRAAPSVDYLKAKIDEILSAISLMTLNGLTVPPALLDQLKELRELVKNAEGATETAKGKTDPSGNGPSDENIQRAEAKIERLKAAGVEVKQTAVELAAEMQNLQQTLVQGASSAFQGLGEALAKGENPLQSALKMITGFIGDFLIQQGEALATAAIIGQAASAAAGPFAALLSLGTAGALVASAALITGGAVVKNIGNFEKGGLFTGESIIRVGESAKARGGGGEWVTPVDKGASLMARELQRSGAISTATAQPSADHTRSSMRNIAKEVANAVGSMQLTTKLRASDIIVAIERYEHGRRLS